MSPSAPRVVEVRTHVLKVRHPEAYLGTLEDGSEPVDDGRYRVREPWRSLYSARFETLLVEVVADDGTSGWGEALAPVGPEVAEAAVRLLLAPQLLGRDATAPRPAYAALRALMRERGHLVGHQADALAAVDTAMWDLAGRVVGVPVHLLLGGAVRDRVPTYVSGLPRLTDAGRAELAVRWQARGVRLVKLHLGHGVDADLATVDAVTAAAPGLRVAVDAHWVYDLGSARRLAHGLAARGAAFLEAPLPPEDIEGHARLSATAELPVAVGEALRNRYEFAAWLRAGALGLAQPDVARSGITETWAIAELASAHHVPVALHHSVGLAPALAAGVHLSAAIEDCPFLEHQPATTEVASRLLRSPFEGGPTGYPRPTAPGLGIDVDTDAVRALAADRPAIREDTL